MSYRTTEPEWYLAYWADRIERLLSASVRDRHLVPADRSVDVLFHEFMADDVATVERIYETAGLTMTAEARAAIDRLPGRPRAGQGRPGRLRRAPGLRRRARRAAGAVRLLLRPLRRAGGGALMAKIDKAVDRLIDERPGAELLLPRYDDPAHPVADGIWRSGGTTAAYLIGTDAGRVVVNTGMGFEAPHHKRVFDAVHPGPTPYIVTTQGHVDHVGGVGLFREPGHPVRGPGRQPGLPGRRPAHPALPLLHRHDLVRPAARDHRPPGRGEPRRPDGPGPADPRHPVRRPRSS